MCAESILSRFDEPDRAAELVELMIAADPRSPLPYIARAQLERHAFIVVADGRPMTKAIVDVGEKTGAAAQTLANLP